MRLLYYSYSPFSNIKNYIVVACKMFLILFVVQQPRHLCSKYKIERVEMENNKKKFFCWKIILKLNFELNLFCICSDIKMQFAFEGAEILRTCAVSSNCRIRERLKSNHEVLEKILKNFWRCILWLFEAKIAKSQYNISIYVRALACRRNFCSYLAFFGACMCSWMQIACYSLSLTSQSHNFAFCEAYFAIHDSKVKQSILRRYEEMAWAPIAKHFSYKKKSEDEFIAIYQSSHLTKERLKGDINP